MSNFKNQGKISKRPLKLPEMGSPKSKRTDSNVFANLSSFDLTGLRSGDSDSEGSAASGLPPKKINPKEKMFNDAIAKILDAAKESSEWIDKFEKITRLLQMITNGDSSHVYAHMIIDIDPLDLSAQKLVNIVNSKIDFPRVGSNELEVLEGVAKTFDLFEFYKFHAGFQKLTVIQCSNILVKSRAVKEKVRSYNTNYVNIYNIMVSTGKISGLYDISVKRLFAATGLHVILNKMPVTSSLSSLFDLTFCKAKENKEANNLIFPGCEWLIKLVISQKIALDDTHVGTLYSICLLLDFLSYMNTDKEEKKMNLTEWMNSNPDGSCMKSALRNNHVMGKNGPVLSECAKIAASDMLNNAVLRQTGAMLALRQQGLVNMMLELKSEDMES